jgi:hypothetical protein
MNNENIIIILYYLWLLYKLFITKTYGRLCKQIIILIICGTIVISLYIYYITSERIYFLLPLIPYSIDFIICKK